MRDAAIEMIKKAKSKGLPVFVSSSDSTDHFDKYLNAGADAVILGEADQTLIELLQAIQSNNSLNEIDGIAIKEG